MTGRPEDSTRGTFAWDPARYLGFGGERLRPALDLLARVPAPAPTGEAPARIVDLGCGPGTVTRLLAERFEGAAITGIDASNAMLARAQVGGGPIEWRRADIADWQPPGPVDLIFSNAALHWLGNHAALFARLVDALAPGGILAVQMPRNFDRPSHTAIAETVRQGPWRERLEPLLGPAPVAPPTVYHRLLAPLCAEVDVWETDYLHALDGDDPVARWTRGSALGPFLEHLAEGAERDAFLAAYARRLRIAYPPEADGTTLFAFRRLFLVARKG